MALKTTHIVVQGDTLWSIAQTYKTTVESIKELNNLTSDKIIVGQILTVAGERTAVTSNSDTVTVQTFGLLAGTTRTVLFTWYWPTSKVSKTEDYNIRWEYRIKNTTEWRFGQEETVGAADVFEATYNVDENAEAVRAWIEPIGKTYTVKNGEEEVEKQYTFSKSAWVYYNFANNPPKKPEAPTVTLSKQTLTVKLTNIDLFESNVEGKRQLQFWVIKDDGSFTDEKPVPYKNERKDLVTTRMTYTTTVEAGYDYYVRYRALVNNQPGEWSDDSDPVSALPNCPKITQIVVKSDTAIEVTWQKVNNAKTYTIEYAPVLSVVESGLAKEAYFNAGNAQKSEFSVEENLIEKNGLATEIGITNIAGSNYYIRICSVNANGDKSEWSEITTFSIGTKPTAPTTWSSTISAVVGDSLNLYWLHNSEDSSVSNYAKLHLKIIESDTVVVGEQTYNICVVQDENSNPQHVQYEGLLDGDWLIRVNKSDPEERTDNTYVCQVNTLHDIFQAGYKIEWDVCTAGVKIVDGERIYGDYSMTRKVDIYSPPVFSSMSLENPDGTIVDPLLSFPFYLKAQVGTATNQKPITYFVNVTAQEGYTTVDSLGNTKGVSKGSSVYSKHFDISDNNIEEEFNASNIDLENNITYKVTCTVSMSSGLKATDSREFRVAWIDEVPVPYAEIGIYKNDVSAQVTPYVADEYVDDILLSVYRREYDGTFTEIITDVESGSMVVDPHPALDYARYRIVAKQISTGGINYSDIPAYPVKEKSIVLQWDEPWQYHDKEAYEIEDETHSPSTSILKLPYNIEVSNSHSPDVSLIKYVGRERPVSYYGTQLGETASWNVVIPKHDTDTLYAIRRLARWMGDVYVREPSGSGYWANIKISYNQSYNDLTISITFNITPVEGGM